MNKSKVNERSVWYLRMPLILIAFLACMNAWIYTYDIKMGIAVSGFVVLYSIIAIIMYFYCNSKRIQDMVLFAADFAQVQKQLIKYLELPYGLMDRTGRIMWMNSELERIIGDNNFKYIFTLFHEVTEDTLRFDGGKNNIKVNYKDRNYRMDMDSLDFDENFRQNPDEDNCIIAFYLFDETEKMRLQKENIEQKMVAGLIYLDNYDDALESVEDVRRSLLGALIERKINKYFSSMNAVIKKVEKDKYFLVIQQKYVSQLQSNKFSILDEIKSVSIGNEMAVTASIGLGVNGENYIQNCDYSRVAIDLALGRGGDQAVIKDGDKIYFYGGKTKQVEKNTRVKARVKAHALRELLETKDNVIIMGHQLSDIDAFGAAIGIYRICKTINKRAYIVLNEVTTSVRPVMERFVGNEEYEEDMFIKNSRAVEIIDDNTAVVVVDVNRPSYVECPEILGIAKAIVILDHHRQSSEIIENASLSYIEPYASSASEMVAEILQYIYDGIKLKQAEADALYGGILIDTQNFTNGTGVRTFEAAAYLKKNGANVTAVRRMFRDDMEDFKARADAIKNTEVYENKYAISVLSAEGLDSPTVVGAQTANELLNIKGINASFVMTEYNGKIYVSARSIDDLNVQLIMERMGGGGHMNTAGAQLDCTMEEAIGLLKRTIDEMIESGDL
ncbi:MAG: DHH family phosphoesterase [Lachnospiraceae bacterium]|nr:DHH family phosphoesterase [Lachnospiraceae bacterium]